MSKSCENCKYIKIDYDTAKYRGIGSAVEFATCTTSKVGYFCATMRQFDCKNNRLWEGSGCNIIDKYKESLPINKFKKLFKLKVKWK